MRGYLGGMHRLARVEVLTRLCQDTTKPHHNIDHQVTKLIPDYSKTATTSSSTGGAMRLALHRVLLGFAVSGLHHHTYVRALPTRDASLLERSEDSCKREFSKSTRSALV